MKDLEEAIKLHNDSLSHYPPDHPGYSNSFNNLANGLRLRYLHLGSLGDLDKAIKLYAEVRVVCPLVRWTAPAALTTSRLLYSLVIISQAAKKT